MVIKDPKLIWNSIKLTNILVKLITIKKASTSEINLDPDLTENEEINRSNTLEEIRKAVRTLKNNKSSGVDMILNEHIKYSFDIPHIQQLYVKPV